MTKKIINRGKSDDWNFLSAIRATELLPLRINFNLYNERFYPRTIRNFIERNNIMAIVVLSSPILPIMHSRQRISNIEIAEKYSRSRVSPAVTPVRDL